VHGMDDARVRHCPESGNKRLGKDLAAENPLARLLLAAPPLAPPLRSRHGRYS